MTALKDRLQLTRLADLDGKTIKPDGTSDNYEHICLQFTDGSFAIIRGYGRYGSDYCEIYSEPIEDCGINPYELHELGLLTKEELPVLIAEQERKDREAEEQREREQWERLNKRYGK